MKLLIKNSARCLLVCFCLISATQAQDSGNQSRTWEDATGSFKIDAVLVDHNDQLVRLKKSDGRVVNVPLDKLSKKDRDFIANLQPKSSDNPFAGGVKPVMDRKIAQVGDNLNVLATFDCEDTLPLPAVGKEILVGGTELPDALKADGGPPRVKHRDYSALVADTDAYDKVSPPVVLDAQVGMIALSVGRHQAGKSELRRGRVFLARYGSPGANAAIDAGETIDVLDHHEPSDRTLAVIAKGSLYRGGELCLLEGLKSGTATVLLRRTLPGIDRPGFKPKVEWARMVGADHVVARVNDDFYCWNVFDNTLVYKVPGLRANPTISPGGNYLAIPHNGKAAIVLTATCETLGTVNAQNPHLVPEVRFDPSGSLLVLAAGNQLAVWDLVAGNMKAEITMLRPTGYLAGWVDSRHVLTQLAGLIDIELGLPIWYYSLPTGGKVSMIDGGFLATDTLRGAKIVSLPLPHPPAERAAKALQAGGDEIFVIQPGSEVSIKIESTSGVAESEIRNALATAVERAGWVVSDSAPTTLVAKIGRGNEQKLEYQMRSIGAGRGNGQTQTATITPFTMSFEIQRGGKTLWTRKSENYVPRMIFLRGKNETLQDAVSKYERPDAGFFERLTLPARIPKDEIANLIGRSRIKQQGWIE